MNEGKRPQTDPSPPTETNEERDARLQAEADEIERAVAFRRLPVYYEERRQSDGESGARYYTEHQPAKATEHNTVPDGLIIIERTPAPPPEMDAQVERTPPMGQPAVRQAPRPKGFSDTQPMPLFVAPSPLPPAVETRLSRPQIDRTEEVTAPIDERVPAKLRATTLTLVAIAFGFALATTILIVVVKLGGVTNNASATPSTSAKLAPIPSTLQTPASAATIASAAPAPPSVSIEKVDATPIPVESAPRPQLTANTPRIVSSAKNAIPPAPHASAPAPIPSVRVSPPPSGKNAHMEEEIHL